MIEALPMTAERRTVPTAAIWLGGLGLVPFIVCGAFILTGTPGLVRTASYALMGYGAIILSFLGGVRWGFATSGLHAATSNLALMSRLCVSVMPPLVAW